MSCLFVYGGGDGATLFFIFCKYNSILIRRWYFNNRQFGSRSGVSEDGDLWFNSDLGLFITWLE